ncbi:hypothetical protein [Streptomyces sp. NPDC056242]|uniref:hypothetical protein n=1 Tax=Streptomyces sp. NPDC056242 TaxID=3345760 RepID=UPI0035E30A5D
MAMAMAMAMRMWDQILMRTVGPRVERGEDLTDLTFRNLGALVDSLISRRRPALPRRCSPPPRVYERHDPQ